MSTEPEPSDNVIRLDVGGIKGRLTTRLGKHIPVRVFERDADHLMLVLMVKAGEELTLDPAQPLVLEYVSTRGLVRFHGHGVLQERDVVRFELSEAPEVTQRREFVRVPTLQAVVLDGEGVTKTIKTQAIDLSGGGMLLGGAADLELDAVVHFTLDLGPGCGTIEGRARVVRTDHEGRRGLEFEAISRDAQQRLIRFIFQRQREALAKFGHVSDHRRTG
jgi:c-di-GMP-binding flagellar brake protein YcgR